MRGLRKYLTPFAPDQSGAVSVLFELGGIVVICDAGGCTGNVCGYPKPLQKKYPMELFKYPNVSLHLQNVSLKERIEL